MHFSREALRGIFSSLSRQEQFAISDACHQRNIRIEPCGNVYEGDLHIVQEVMVKLGHVVPVPLSEQWAEEYEDIMAAQELISK